MKTELILLVDRSGSMESIKANTEKAFNDFLEQQKKLPDQCNVTLIKFDDQYEKVYESKPIDKVGEVTIEPRGWTALLDALGKTINSVEQRFLSASAEESPDNVIFVVLSDGAENNSKEYDGPTIKKLIQDKTAIQNWKFVYFGTNQDAIGTATKLGFEASKALNFAATSEGLIGTSSVLHRSVTSYRSGHNYSMSAEDRSVAMGEGIFDSTSSTIQPFDTKAAEDIFPPKKDKNKS